MVPKLLVVGGTGFIGENVIGRANALGWETTSISLSSSSKANAKNLKCDSHNSQELAKTLCGEKFDYVVNCVGYLNHSLYFDGGQQQLDFHFKSLTNIIDNLDRTQLKCFINLGSGDEYGSAKAPQSEILREMPNSPYAMGKVASSHFLQMLHRTEGFPAVTLRIFLTYGPGQRVNRLIPQVIKACIDKLNFPTSSGEQLRDFCYIDDVVSAIFSALLSSNAHGYILNVGSGEPTSVKEVILRIKSIIGSGNPQFGSIPNRTLENSSLYPDLRLVKEVIGWSPNVSLQEGLTRTISSFIPNE
jgi:nucleoside-diphosphate-sugar epimerase